MGRMAFGRMFTIGTRTVTMLWAFTMAEPKFENHAICDVCWMTKNPHRGAVRMRYPEAVRCCFCGAVNASGIFVRARRPDCAEGDSHYHVAK